MRVLHLLSNSSRSRAEGLIWPLCQRASKGFDYHSIYLSPAQPLMRGKQNYWVKKSKRLDKESLVELSKKIRTVDPDVIHIHGVDLVPVIMAAQPKIKAKKILSAYQKRSSNWFKKTIESLVGQSIRWVDTVCFSLRSLEESYVESGLPEAKARFVMDATKIPRVVEIDRKTICDQAYFLLYPNSSHLRRKAFWMELFKTCESLNVGLLAQPSDIKKLKERSLVSKVLKPIQDGVDLLSVVKNAHAVLVLNDTQYPELNIVEVIHMGAPIIAVSSSAVSELVLHGLNGFLCSASSFEDWRASLETLAKDYSVRERMRKMAKQYAQQQLTIARWERDMNQLYSGLFRKQKGK